MYGMRLESFTGLMKDLRVSQSSTVVNMNISKKNANPLARPRPAAIIAALPISLAFSAATACSWPEQAFAAGGDNGNESFESRFLCTGTRLCYTTDLWRTDIHVLVYIIENRVRHVARDIQTAGFSQWLASLEEEKG